MMLATPAGAIFNGYDANPKGFPWFVTLTRNGQESCGGALIATDAVITAAHCVTPSLRAGTHVVFNYRTRSAVSVGIDRIVENHFSQTQHLNDVAIVFIDRRPPSANPIELVSTDPPLAAQLTAIGFGCSSAPLTSCAPPTRLQGITLQRANNDDCAPLAATELCLVSARASLNKGDSGGPVMVKAASHWQLAAVSTAVITGDGGDVIRPYRAAVTSITQERAWIDSTLAGGPNGGSTGPVLTPTGLGPVRIGMTIPQAKRALGGRLRVFPSVNGCEFLQLPGGSQGVALHSRTVDLIEAGNSVHTSRGIHLGSSRADMQAAYGPTVRPAPPHSELSGVSEFWWVRSGDLVLEFGIYHGNVASMEAGPSHVVATFGECA